MILVDGHITAVFTRHPDSHLIYKAITDIRDLHHDTSFAPLIS